MNPISSRPLTAPAALSMLRDGNRRFRRNVQSVDASEAKRATLVDGQAPNAVILSCADSRVPAELVFDCGLGDLFVVRVAGNVVAPSVVGSIEYAASALGTELVVVMGHTGCGAVKATIEALTKGGRASTENIGDIVERIVPAVSHLLDRKLSATELCAAATRANVVHAADQLRRSSRLLAERIATGKLVVVGAEYALATGEVTFFDAPAALDAAAA